MCKPINQNNFINFVFNLEHNIQCLKQHLEKKSNRYTALEDLPSRTLILFSFGTKLKNVTLFLLGKKFLKQNCSEWKSWCFFIAK